MKLSKAGKKKELFDINDDLLIKELGLDKINQAKPNLFYDLGLRDPILKSIKKQKFEQPTAIQEKTIPLVLAGKDVIAGSATGSGKTLAFGAGIIQNSMPGRGIQALILTPTRELAEQVAKNLKVFSSNQLLKISAVYGGVSINTQIKNLKRADIVVGTPGRILDHINRKTMRFDKLKTLVLDEADTMFDMGFIDEVEKIIAKCPKEKRQTLLFSATLSNDINKLAQRHTKDAVKVVTEVSVDPQKLTQTYYKVSKRLKFSLLVHLLKQEEAEAGMVFCNTRRDTDQVVKDLKYSGVAAIAIHGGFSQDKRNKALKSFHAKRVQVLVCTDVAARGLDIQGVSHVYNYDLPRDGKQYIHRVGRTARAGKEGKAVNLLSPRDREHFSRIVKDHSIKVSREQMPDIQREKKLSPML